MKVLWNILRNIECKIIQIQIFASRKQRSTRLIKGSIIYSKSNWWHIITSKYWHEINYILMKIYLLRYSLFKFQVCQYSCNVLHYTRIVIIKFRVWFSNSAIRRSWEELGLTCILECVLESSLASPPLVERTHVPAPHRISGIPQNVRREGTKCEYQNLL